MEYNKINPKAFSNTAAITGVMGEAIPGTFDRSVGTIGMDPYTKQQQALLTNDQAIKQANQVVPPPMSVETPIVPDYDLNNY